MRNLEAGGICDNISEKTCCSNESFDIIKSSWEQHIGNKNEYMFENYIESIKNLVKNRMANLADEIKQNVGKYKHMYKTGGMHKKLYQNLYSVYQRNFSSTNFSKNWKPAASNCFNYMQELAKSSLCAVCDHNEAKRFSNDTFVDPLTKKESKIVYLNASDVYSYANQCTEYLRLHHHVIRFFKKMQVAYLFINKAAKFVSFRPIIIQKKYMEMIALMKKCSNDISLCSDPKILHYFMIGPFTKLDRKNYDSITTLARSMAQHYSEQGKIHILNSTKRRNRVLQTQTELKHIYKNGPYKLWIKKDSNVRYVLDQSNRFKRLLHRLDNKMKI